MENGDIIGYRLYREATIIGMMKSNVGASVSFIYIFMHLGCHFFPTIYLFFKKEMNIIKYNFLPLKLNTPPGDTPEKKETPHLPEPFTFHGIN